MGIIGDGKVRFEITDPVFISTAQLIEIGDFLTKVENREI